MSFSAGASVRQKLPPSAALPEADPNDPDTAAPDDLSYAGDEDRDIARLLERAEEDGDI